MIKNTWVLRSLFNLIHTEVAQPEQEGRNPYSKDYAEMKQRSSFAPPATLMCLPWTGIPGEELMKDLCYQDQPDQLAT